MVNRRLIWIGAVVAALAIGGAVTGVVLASSGNGGSSAQPAQTGTLDMHPIAGNFKPDKTKLSDCNSEVCYEQAFGDVAYYKGPKAALALFAHEMAVNRAIDAGCHPIAHYIGAATLARVPRQHSEVVRCRVVDLLVRLLPRHPRARVLRHLDRGRPDQGGAARLLEPVAPEATSSSSTSASTASAMG